MPSLNGHVFPWTGVNAEVFWESIFLFLLFLVSINNLAESLFSNTQLFIAVLSLFLIIHNVSFNESNNDLCKIISWTFQ